MPTRYGTEVQVLVNEKTKQAKKKKKKRMSFCPGVNSQVFKILVLEEKRGGFIFSTQKIFHSKHLLVQSQQ